MCCPREIVCCGVSGCACNSACVHVPFHSGTEAWHSAGSSLVPDAVESPYRCRRASACLRRCSQQAMTGRAIGAVVRAYSNRDQTLNCGTHGTPTEAAAATAAANATYTPLSTRWIPTAKPSSAVTTCVNRTRRRCHRVSPRSRRQDSRRRRHAVANHPCQRRRRRCRGRSVRRRRRRGSVATGLNRDQTGSVHL